MSTGQPHEFTIDYSKYLKSKNLYGDNQRHKNLMYSILLDCGKKGLLSNIGEIEHLSKDNPVLPLPNILRNVFCDNIMVIQLIPNSKITAANYTPLCGPIESNMHNHVRQYVTSKGHAYVSCVKPMRTCKTNVNAGTWIPGAENESIVNEPLSNADVVVDLDEENDFLLQKDLDAVLIDPSECIEFEDNIRNKFETSNKTSITKWINRNPHVLERYRQIYPLPQDWDVGYIMFKISFSHWSWDTAIGFVNDKENDLHADLIFVTEFDATVDVGCHFNKQEVIEKMEKNVLLNQPKHLRYFAVDNNKYVGKECVTLMRHVPIRLPVRHRATDNLLTCIGCKSKIKPRVQNITNLYYSKECFCNNCSNKYTAEEKDSLCAQYTTRKLISTRNKGYVKFRQTAETHSITSCIGMHLASWVNNPEPILDQTIEKSLDNGFTRLEITFYAQQLSKEDFATAMQDFYTHLAEQKLLFECSIEKQWKAVTDKLTHSIGIVDLDTNEIAVAWWCNLLTKRVCGSYGILTEIQSKLNSEDIKNRILAKFSFRNNIPMHYITLTRKGLNTNVGYIQIDSYVRTDNGTTDLLGIKERGFLTYNASTHTRPNIPTTRGLIETTNCLLHIPQTQQKLSQKVPCNYTQINIVYPPLLHVQELSTIELQNTTLENLHENNMANNIETLGKRYHSRLSNRTNTAGRIGQYSLHTVKNGECIKIWAFILATTDADKTYKTYLLLDDRNRVYRSNTQITRFLENNKDYFSMYKSVHYWGKDSWYAFSFTKVRNYSHPKTNTKCVEVSNIVLNPRLSIQCNNLTYSNTDVSGLSTAMETLTIQETNLQTNMADGLPWSPKYPCTGDMRPGTYTVMEVKRHIGNIKFANRFFLQIGDNIYKSSFMLSDLLNDTTSPNCFDKIMERNNIFHIVVEDRRATYRKKMQQVIRIET